MSHWLQTLDTDLFRFINLRLMNPVCDVLMPFLSGNAFFVPALVLVAGIILWKGRLRGLLCLCLLAAAVGVTDGLVCNTMKHALARPRPFLTLPDVHCLVGRGGSGSMPSSHAANWFAATTVALVYYRRSLWVMLPAAVLVSFSRIYNGVHYPSDVLVGAILGAGSASAVLWLAETLWVHAGRMWFPRLWVKLPSLVAPPACASSKHTELCGGR